MLPNSPHRGYWAHANFKSVDAINAEIWTQSPLLQCKIQEPHALTEPGSVGPQQAMLEDDPETVLPWVPDIVGTEAVGERAIIIFGSAYAGFMCEYSRRCACLKLNDFKGAKDWIAFQKLFLKYVVAPDGDYYQKLERLLTLAGISANQIILSDLCPNSIVGRSEVINNRRRDDSRQSKAWAKVFSKYVENPMVEDLTWRRILESRANRVIALGHVAEHGLLRLFSRRGASIFCNGHKWTQRVDSSGEAWVGNYADLTKTLYYWLRERRWWTVSIPGRELRLLPVYHPAKIEKWDPGYVQTLKVLADFIST
jgi:hypothetical protein